MDFHNTDAAREGMPGLWYCGICREDPRIQAANAAIPPESDHSVAGGPRGEADLTKETRRIDHLGIDRRRIGTDGSAKFPRDPRLRRAGWSTHCGTSTASGWSAAACKRLANGFCHMQSRKLFTKQHLKARETTIFCSKILIFVLLGEGWLVYLLLIN